MEDRDFIHKAGSWLVAGALLGMGIGIKEGLLPTPFGTTQNIVMQLIVIVANSLVLVGVIGFARSGAAGSGRMAKTGLGLALVASALFLPLEVLVAFDLELGGMLLGLSAMVQGLGLLLAGVAVLRTGTWRGWLRYAPVLCGLYTFLVLIPALALSEGGYNAWALAGWQLPFLLLGMALRRPLGAPSAGQAAAGA